MMRGNWTFRRPALTCWMVRPAPQVMTRATASPGPATGSGRCSNSNGRFGPRNTIAFMGFRPSCTHVLTPATLEDLFARAKRL